jgi:hypothetical protein
MRPGAVPHAASRVGPRRRVVRLRILPLSSWAEILVSYNKETVANRQRHPIVLVDTDPPCVLGEPGRRVSRGAHQRFDGVAGQRMPPRLTRGDLASR